MARSTERGVGNTPRDQASIDWMMETGELRVIDPEEEGIPFPAKLQWDGAADTEGSPWMIPPDGKRCVGKAFLRDEDGDYVVDKDNKRIMRPCWSWPMKGMRVCLSHGGGLSAVRRAAENRMASALDAATGRLVTIATDPETSDQDALKAIKELMDRVGVRGAINIDTSQPGWRDVIREAFEGRSEEKPARPVGRPRKSTKE